MDGDNSVGLYAVLASQETHRRMENFLLFNPQNPTGRYKLKLESSRLDDSQEGGCFNLEPDLSFYL